METDATLNDNADSAKTMRIDIHPDVLGERLARKKKELKGTPSDTTTSFVARRSAPYSTNSDYDKLLQSIYDGVVITDRKGRITDFNSRILDFLVCDGTELVGSRFVDWVSGAEDSVLLPVIQKNLEDHRYTLIEAHCVRKDKSTFPAEIAVNKIDLDGGGHLCFFIRDITVRKKAQEALEEAVSRLEAHDRARTHFVSNVSHELRTPLTSMIYAVNNMLSGVLGNLAPEIKRYLEILQGDCKRLLNTVNDILDISKLDSKTLTLAKTRVPIVRLVRRSVESLMVQADRKNIRMHVNSYYRSLFALCDPQKMERVILNVVGNAIKFTPSDGEIEVTVSIAGNVTGNTSIQVRDNGSGIPPEALPRISERYFTVGEQPSGSGLGLAISREIIELHDGCLKVSSPPPGHTQGTLVEVTIPIVDPPEMVIVEDDPGILAVLKHQVTAQGYRVFTAARGNEGFELIKSAKPDIVLLDVSLPGMDGTEIILKMKSDNEFMRTPVIVLTGVSLSGSKAEILRNFAIPAMQKPWSESELLDRIEAAFLGATAFGG